MEVPVQAVAVGAFQQDHVGLVDGVGIRHHRRIAKAKVAAEGDFLRIAVLGKPQFDDCGAQDVPGIAEAHGDARQYFHLAAVFDAAELRHDRLAVRLRVQRLDVRQALVVCRRILMLD